MAERCGRTRRLSTRFVLLVLACATLAACGGSATASLTSAPAVAPTLTATVVAPSTSAAASLSPAEAAAAHITKNVTYLMSISDPHVILAWIDSEDTWVKAQTLPILSDYSAAVQAAAILLKDGGKQNVINDKALAIIDAARGVPGVVLQ